MLFYPAKVTGAPRFLLGSLRDKIKDTFYVLNGRHFYDNIAVDGKKQGASANAEYGLLSFISLFAWNFDVVKNLTGFRYAFRRMGHSAAEAPAVNTYL